MNHNEERKEITKSLLEAVQEVTEVDVKQLAKKYKATTKTGPSGVEIHVLNGVSIWKQNTKFNQWKVAKIDKQNNYTDRATFGKAEDAFKYAQKQKG